MYIFFFLRLICRGRLNFSFKLTVAFNLYIYIFFSFPVVCQPVNLFFSVVLDTNSVLLKENFARLPMKMEAPERVLGQAHGQARHITDFLQENGMLNMYYRLSAIYLLFVIIVQFIFFSSQF